MKIIEIGFLKIFISSLSFQRMFNVISFNSSLNIQSIISEVSVVLKVFVNAFASVSFKASSSQVGDE